VQGLLLVNMGAMLVNLVSGILVMVWTLSIDWHSIIGYALSVVSLLVTQGFAAYVTRVLNE
jgi:hypothetical protein